MVSKCLPKSDDKVVLKAAPGLEYASLMAHDMVLNSGPAHLFMRRRIPPNCIWEGGGGGGGAAQHWNVTHLLLLGLSVVDFIVEYNLRPSKRIKM